MKERDETLGRLRGDMQIGRYDVILEGTKQRKSLNNAAKGSMCCRLDKICLYILSVKYFIW